MGGQSYNRLFTDQLCPEICIICIFVKPLIEKPLMQIAWNQNLIIIIIIIIGIILFIYRYFLKVLVLFVKIYTLVF